MDKAPERFTVVREFWGYWTPLGKFKASTDLSKMFDKRYMFPEVSYRYKDVNEGMWRFVNEGNRGDEAWLDGDTLASLEEKGLIVLS